MNYLNNEIKLFSSVTFTYNKDMTYTLQDMFYDIRHNDVKYD